MFRFVNAIFGIITMTQFLIIFIKLHYAINNPLRINNISGTFATGTNITGNDSSAVWSLTSFDDQLLPTTPFADNKILETDGDAILDFSESDPFSEGDL